VQIVIADGRSVCLSVRPSVRLYVSFVSHTYTVQDIETYFATHVKRCF